MNLKTGLMTAAACVMMASAAQAIPVSGQLSLNGYAQAIGSASMGYATGINFANQDGTSVSGNSGMLSSFGGGSGSFAALGSCNASASTGCGTIKNISSFGSAGAMTSFLTLTTSNGAAVSFDLGSITSVGHNTATNTVSFVANGTINFSGYDSTAGTFYLSAQGDNITSFSATTLSAATVPEPMSLALLGTSLAAVGLIRRKRA